MAFDNYLIDKELWKQKFFRKTAKILFFGDIYACFLGNDAVFMGRNVSKRSYYLAGFVTATARRSRLE